MRTTARYLLITLLLLTTAAISTAQTTTAPDPAQFTLEPVAEGFTRALYVTHAGDGTDRLFMVQQNGIIYVMENGTLLPTPFLDASGLISSDALGSGYTERGLLGLAFHPDYATNGQFFINYTELSSNDTIVARFTASGSDPNVANPESGDIIFRTAQPYANHNGGHIDFGPDGFLYISVGDGGSAGDPLNSGQQPDTLLGTLLRIDVDSGLPYAIPESNPFVGSTFGAEEVWAYGLRNVWRFSFDRTTGDMYMGDVGQNRWEEVNYQPAGQGGQNYGWNIMEGTNPFSGAAIPADLTGPIAEYQHINGNCSVTGGYVYRGEAIPTLQGAYIYGDYCSGQVWAAYRDASGVWQSDLLIDTDFTISSFGEDESGELYMIHYGSSRIPAQVLRFAPVE